ncbi:MAG: YidB family protein [Gammaproteobacteria bacterium]|nr:MAG: YidB family protein [Gammaproteobacteria bacterium]
MNLLQMGAQIMAQQLGGDTDSGSLQEVLGKLIGDGDSMDIGSLVAKMQGSGGLGEIVQSWLGDGENSAISTSQLQDVIDTDRLQQTAAQLGTDQDSLLETLAKVIPQMVDNGSKGGSLLDSLGGLDGVANMAKGFFK